MNRSALKIDRSVVEAIWLSVALWTFTIVVFTLTSLANPRSIWPALPTWHGLDALAGLALMAPVYVAVRGAERLSLKPRVSIIAAVVLLAGLVESIVDTGLHDWLLRNNPDATHIGFWRRTQINAVIYVPIFGLYAVAVALLRSNRLMRDRERQLAEAKAAAHQAQLAALRYQLNPHFLFNTLNAISTLIVTRRNDEAEAMMSKLADFLRTSLSADPDDFVELQDELATLQAYLDIESVRFGERLAVEFDCPPELSNALVPNFLLQPIVENAIKYAVSPARRTVTVQIEASTHGEDLVLVVEDDGEPLDAATARKGAGVGLRNVRERLQVLYGARGVLEAAPRQRGFLAIVRLPLQRARVVAEAA